MKIIKYLTKNNLNRIKLTLDQGGIIILPTDTVYGLSCNSLDERAIKRLFDCKKRNEKKPICVLTDSYKKINSVAIIKEEEKELMDKYFPGDLTIILEKKEIVPNILTANQNTIGVRIPNDKKALKILENYPYPLATTSLNMSGEAPITKVEDMIDAFKDKVDIMIIGKSSKIGIPSTIVKIEDGKIVVLRQGNLKVD